MTFTLGVLQIFAGSLLVGAAWSEWRQARLGVLAVLLVSCELLLPISPVIAEDPFDSNIRAEMLARKSGQIAHIESVYNDIFVHKDASILTMAFQWKGWQFHKSEVNLATPRICRCYSPA